MFLKHNIVIELPSESFFEWNYVLLLSDKKYKYNTVPFTSLTKLQDHILFYSEIPLF